MASSLLVSLALLLSHAAAAAMAQVAVVGGDAPELPRSELAAVFRVMADLLGDPTWPQLHPRPCTDTPWPGLQCEAAPDDARRLRATRLHFGPDVASPPCRPGAALAADALRGLPHLKTLSLFACFDGAAAAVELPPGLFANASALEQVVLKSNPGLTGAVPAALGGLPRLRVLSLSQNALRGAVPAELGALAALQQLDLSYNNLTGAVPEEVGGMASLTILDLSWNGLTGGVPRAVGKLRSLQKADLSYNRLTGRVPPELGSLHDLVFLDLGHNGLTGPLPPSLAGLGKLQYLLLQDNPLGTAVPAVVGSLRRLQVLGLSGCGLTGPIPPAAFFDGLTNLTALSLDRNRLDGPVPASLALPHLGQLNLSQNRLAGEIALPGDFVARLGRRLDVRGNRQLCVGKGLQGTGGNLGARPCEAGDDAARAERSGAAAGWRRVYDDGVVGSHTLVVLLFLVYRL